MTCICGAPVAAHFRKGVKMPCEYARRQVGYVPVNFSRLLQLAAARHSAAHQRALETLREVHGKLYGHCWCAWVGGRQRGFRVFGKTRAEVRQLVDAYYRERWKERRLRRAS